MSSKKIILTGDRPTGCLHLGHYVGSLAARVELQEFHRQFVMIADAQALTDHTKEPEKIKQHIFDVVLDYLAVGINPEKTTIFIQSLVRALPELTMYYLNLVTWNRLKHNPTVKIEIQQKGYGENVSAGFMVYPISQAADITAFKADLVPVGNDQIPMIEQTIEIVRKFNCLYKCSLLIEPQAQVTKFPRLPGINGTAKMSKTQNNAIFLSDSSDILAKKIKGMYTDPNHLRVEDPGQVDENPVFIYLDAFGNEKEKIEELKNHYRRGGLGDAVVKKYLLEVLEAFLAPIRKRRNEYSRNIDYVMEILFRGSQIANEVADETLSEVKKAMGLIRINNGE